MMKKFIIFLCSLSIAVDIHAQKIIPPNPIAESFKLYGDIPISYSTGAPDITIPIYVIQVGDFSLPIELKYHINSLRPASCISNVALGWSLHYGGIVSRTMYNKPDEYPNSYATYGTGLGTGSNDQLKYIDESYDSEKDIFNYNIAGAYGEFILNNGTAYQMSSRPVGISFINTGNGNINITNEKGHLFKFGYGQNEITYTNGTANSAISSWMLTEIALPSNQNISYTYEDVPGYDVFHSQYLLTLTDNFTLYNYATDFGWSNLQNGPYVCNGPVMNQTTSSIYTRHLEKNIKEIQFPNGKIVFDLTTDKRKITGIKIYQGSALLKAYEFQYPNTGGSMSGMAILRKVIVKDAQLNSIQEYQFEYYSESNIDKDANTDFWGYYNGAGTVNSFPNGQYTTYSAAPVSFRDGCLATTNNDNTQTLGQSKEASYSACLTNALKKIIYPTQGSTKFEYGMNQFRYGGGTIHDGNGLRVEKIINDDGLGHLTLKTYQYEPQQRNGDYVFGINDFARTTYSVGSHITSNNGIQTFGISGARQVVYESNVSSRIANTLLNIQYSKVTEVIGDGTENIGKNVYYYSYNNNHEYSYFKTGIPGNQYPLRYEGPTFYLTAYKNWDNGLLYKKEVYKSNETTPISYTTYNYNYHYDLAPFVNTCVFKFCNYYPAGSSGTDSLQRDYIWNNTTTSILNVSDDEKLNYLPHVYGYYNYNIVTGWLELQSEVYTENTSAGAISSSVEYQYNGAKIYFPSKISKHNSDGTIKTTDRQYPYDFNTIEPYQTMVSKNILAPVIMEKDSLSNGSTKTLLSIRKTNYNNWGNNIFQPINVQESKGNNPLEIRLGFDSYDATGNLLQLHKADDMNESYIWGYNNRLPIAQAINAKAKDIFYTSFEDAEGNSSDGDSRTGKKSRTGGYTKSLTNLSNGTYNLTWWQKSGSTWNLQRNIITVSTATYNISLGGQVDELRFYPIDAQMTTFTYEPLIGMTSQCDPRNTISYYEYDDFGRLKRIRDQDKNILKTFDYKYQIQQ